MSLCGTEDYPEVENVTTPVARKEHLCGECHRKIYPGETYERRFIVFMGDPETQKLCGDCRDLMRRFFDSLRDAGLQHELSFYTGELRGAIIELRQEYGLLVEGFEYPSDEDI